VASTMLEPYLEAFAEFVRTIEFHPPEIPYVSNLTGKWIRPEEAQDPDYWVRHLRQTVRFSDGMQVLARDAGRIFLEVGPGTTLSSLARQHLEKALPRRYCPRSVIPGPGIGCRISPGTLGRLAWRRDGGTVSTRMRNATVLLCLPILPTRHAGQSQEAIC
jgi:acyl transferase domain-containing protein